MLASRAAARGGQVTRVCRQPEAAEHGYPVARLSRSIVGLPEQYPSGCRSEGHGTPRRHPSDGVVSATGALLNGPSRVSENGATDDVRCGIGIDQGGVTIRAELDESDALSPTPIREPQPDVSHGPARRALALREAHFASGRVVHAPHEVRRPIPRVITKRDAPDMPLRVLH